MLKLDSRLLLMFWMKTSKVSSGQAAQVEGPQVVTGFVGNSRTHIDDLFMCLPNPIFRLSVFLSLSGTTDFYMYLSFAVQCAVVWNKHTEAKLKKRASLVMIARAEICLDPKKIRDKQISHWNAVFFLCCHDGLRHDTCFFDGQVCGTARQGRTRSTTRQVEVTRCSLSTSSPRCRIRTTRTST